MKNRFLILALALIMILAFATACRDTTPEVTQEPTDVVAVEPGDVTEPDDDVVEPTVDPEPEEDEIELIVRPAGLIYSLATDTHVQNAIIGARGNETVIGDTPYIEQAGSPTWNIFEGPDGNVALRFTDRVNSWDSMDIRTSELDWDLDNNEYMLTVTGYLPNGGTAIIGGADGPHTRFVEVDVEDGGPFTMSLLLDAETVAGLGSRRQIRLQENDLEDFEIHTVAITLYIPRPEGIVYSLSTDPFIQSLEVGTRETHGYEIIMATPVLNDAGGPTYTIVEGPFAKAIEVRNRNSDYYSIDLDTGAINWDFDNHSYVLTVHGNVTGDFGSVVIGGADGPWVRFAQEEPDENGDFIISLIIDSADVLAEAGSRRWFRLLTTCVEHYTIYEITIEQQ